MIASFTKVYTRKPPLNGPSMDWEKYPKSVTLEGYSKAGKVAYVRASYWPKTKLVSVPSENIVLPEVWKEAWSRWETIRKEKEEFDARRKELVRGAPTYPLKRIMKKGVDGNDINVALTSIFGDWSIYQEPNPDYETQNLAWEAYWRLQENKYRPSYLRE